MATEITLTKALAAINPLGYDGFKDQTICVEVINSERDLTSNSNAGSILFMVTAAPDMEENPHFKQINLGWIDKAIKRFFDVHYEMNEKEQPWFRPFFTSGEAGDEFCHTFDIEDLRTMRVARGSRQWLVWVDVTVRSEIIRSTYSENRPGLHEWIASRGVINPR